MKKGSVRRGERLEIVKEFYTACWEEADYADECRPLKKVNRPLKNKDDYYVDFSDIVRK